MRTELLKPTSTTTTCPVKGEAAYWSVEAGGEVHQDVVWSYPGLIPAAAQIAGLLCFWAERGAEVTVTSPQPACQRSAPRRATARGTALTRFCRRRRLR